MQYNLAYTHTHFGEAGYLVPGQINSICQTTKYHIPEENVTREKVLIDYHIK
jgi:hypothetical protein